MLALKAMGGESAAAWSAFLEDMTRRGLRTPEFVIVDGAPGLDAALAALWPDAPIQRCTVGLLKKAGHGDGRGLVRRDLDWRVASGLPTSIRANGGSGAPGEGAM